MDKRSSAAIAARRARPVRKKGSTAKRRIKTVIGFFFLAILSLIAVGAIFGIIVFVQVSRSLPSLAVLGTSFKPSEGTKIYYSDGKVMAVLATQHRRPVKLADISKNLIDATIATEDSRFYEHKGVDMRGIARAVVRDVSGGDRKEGASTITQQLVRNLEDLGVTREKKLRRKVAEAILAMRIEQSYSKNEILELYLNQIYYGNGAYGAEAAAQTYFHKSAKKLTLAEASMLAGLPQSPSYYSSPEHRESAYRRRDIVLERMLDTGKISVQQREEAHNTKLTLYKPDTYGNRILGAPYVVNYVVGQLSTVYGADAVYNGWNIYTTIDSRIQKNAEEYLKNGLHKYSEYANNGALVSMDPRTGYVRAMVGGLDFKRDQYNVIVQGEGRPPGSSFKPIVYTAAFDTGTADLDTTYEDSPNLDGRTNNGWVPHNYSGNYSGRRMTVREAIALSVNTVAVKCAMDTGLEKVVEYAHKMGIQANIPPYPPIALGPVAVRPIDLCSAYTIFANGGKRAVPMVIQKVVAANGDTILENHVVMEDPHFRPETTQMINEALRGVVEHGTGTAANEVPNAHGKTGTTSDNLDNWFCGYTPELVTVIWAAHQVRDKKGHVVAYKEMPGATGGHVCAPTWRDFMLKAVPIQQAVNKANAQYAQAAEPPKPPDAKKQKPNDKKPVNPAATPTAAPTEGAPGTQPGTLPGAQPGQPGAPNTLQGMPPNPAMPGDPSVPPTTTAPPSTGPAASLPGNSTASPMVRAIPSGARPSTSPRISESAPRLSEPSARHTDSGDEMVTVRLCADTMKRATQWCDSTVERRMRRRDVPGLCRAHHPPPGENQ